MNHNIPCICTLFVTLHYLTSVFSPPSNDISSGKGCVRFFKEVCFPPESWKQNADSKHRGKEPARNFANSRPDSKHKCADPGGDNTFYHHSLKRGVPFQFPLICKQVLARILHISVICSKKVLFTRLFDLCIVLEMLCVTNNARKTLQSYVLNSQKLNVGSWRKWKWKWKMEMENTSVLKWPLTVILKR